jgi:hypothetical protein
MKTIKPGMNSKVFMILIPILFIIACVDENDLLKVTIGDNFISSQTNVVIIDSFAVNMSTILIDSVPTSETGQLLVGKYTDKYLGVIKSMCFFQLDIPEITDINEDAIFDSLTLVLNYSGLSYGDTLQPQSYSVHRVTQDIEKNDDSKLYNTSFFKYDESPIGSLSFYPKPNFHDSIEIRLDDSLGEEFMKLLKDNANEITNSEDFIDFFKGLAIVPGENSSSVLSFEGVDSLINVLLYTHYVEKERVETNYIFQMHSSSTCFNHIEADRTGTLVENLETQKAELTTNETGDISFMQGGLGIVTRIDIPGLSRLLEMDYRKILYKAELILKPVPNSYPSTELPTELVMYNTDKYNRLVSEITTDEGTSIYADLYLDKMYNEDTYYQFDLYDYVSEELSDGYVDTDNGLIISFPTDNMQGSLARVAFDARKGISFKPTLKLYYVFYN